MVVKLATWHLLPCSWFESSVISSGSKTFPVPPQLHPAFESSVISSGSKTLHTVNPIVKPFESSVIICGTTCLIFKAI